MIKDLDTASLLCAATQTEKYPSVEDDLEIMVKSRIFWMVWMIKVTTCRFF